MESVTSILTWGKHFKKKEHQSLLFLGSKVCIYKEKVCEISTCMSRKVKFRQSSDTRQKITSE